MGLTIRDMLPRDLVVLREIYLAGRIAVYGEVLADGFLLEDFDKSTEDEWVLVAEMDGEVVGFSSVSGDDFLHNLFVVQGQHGRGVGKQLLAACFAGKLNKPARLKCLAENSQAIGFYEVNGWVIVEADVDDPMGAYHLMVIS